MKYLFLFSILLNLTAYGQETQINKKIDDNYTIDLENNSSEILADYQNILDSIESFKKFNSNYKTDSEYFSKREKLKSSYIEKAILVKDLYGIYFNKIKTYPDNIQEELNSLKPSIDNYLPSGQLPEHIKVALAYLKPISEYYNQSKSIDKTLKLIKEDNKKGIKSNYYSSVNGINAFGYELLNSNKNTEALKIFNLNVKLYPKDSNVYDSLGECLLQLNKKEEAIKAYKLSLKLDSNNENAKKIIAKNE
jgi:tetratricopeptide (TPR) repeat protein